MSDTIDLDALEALAKAATPGPWEAKKVIDSTEFGEYDAWGIGGNVAEPTWFSDSDMAHTAIEPLEPENATFIAAANPATILALIAELRQERERAVITWEDAEVVARSDYRQQLSICVSRYAKAEAALARAEETIEKVRTLDPMWPRGMYWCPQDMFGRNQIRGILTDYDNAKEADHG